MCCPLMCAAQSEWEAPVTNQNNVTKEVKDTAKKSHKAEAKKKTIDDIVKTASEDKTEKSDEEKSEPIPEFVVTEEDMQKEVKEYIDNILEKHGYWIKTSLVARFVNEVW